MEIIFTKTGNDDHTISCKRKDGTVTWHHVSSFFVLHDICHYSVETVLSLKNAFFGLVAAGKDITDFELPGEQRAALLTKEALFAEHLVNLVVIDYTQGTMDNLVEIFNAVNNEDDPVLMRMLTEKKLGEIRIKYKELMEQWKALPVNDSLQLQFEEE